MPREADPLPVNLENWNKNQFKIGHKRRFIDLMIQIEAIQSVVAAGEISEFAATMLGLDYFNKARGDKTFKPEGWIRFVRSMNGGTVEIPVAWLGVLLGAWDLYMDANDPVPLEKAAGLSGEGRGRNANRKINELIDKYQLAVMVAHLKLDALAKDKILSDDDAFLEVESQLSEIEGGERSKGTIRSAWARWGPFLEDKAVILSMDLPERLP